MHPNRPTCETCPWFNGDPVKDTLCHLDPKGVNRVLVGWCERHPDAPKIVVVTKYSYDMGNKVCHTESWEVIKEPEDLPAIEA